jgi:hypothetical protein
MKSSSHSAHLVVEGLAGTAETLAVHRNRLLMPKFDGPLCQGDDPENPHIGFSSAAYTDIAYAIPLSLCFPQGQGWQTLEFTLTW